MKIKKGPIGALVAITLALSAGAEAQPKAQTRTQVVNTAAGVARALAAPPAAAKGPSADAKEKTIAITGAKIYTGDGEPIEDGVVVLTGEKIISVGKATAAPAGAEVVQAKGMIVTPGLIEPLSQIGLREIDLEPTANDENESQSKERVRAAYRAADAYNPLSVVIPVSRLGGITSAAVVPSGGLISGQSAWADLIGDTASDAIVAAPLALHVHLEIGADPQGGSRGAAVRAVREAFDDARAFQKNKAAWERNQSRPFSASRLDLEALTLALGGGGAKKAAGKVPVVFHVNRASPWRSSSICRPSSQAGPRPGACGARSPKTKCPSSSIRSWTAPSLSTRWAGATTTPLSSTPRGSPSSSPAVRRTTPGSSVRR